MKVEQIETSEEASITQKHITKKEYRDYLVGLGGQNLVYGLIASSFITYFLTDIAFIPTIAVSILLILSKVWDGVNDPLIGAVMDKHVFKNGEKLRPYLKYTPIGIGLFTVLMFVVFGTSPELVWLRISYFVLMYAGWDVAYTMQDVAIWGITAAVTPNPQEREGFVKWARVVSSIVGGIAMFAIPMIFEVFVNATQITPQLGSVICAIVFGFIGALISIKAYSAKERVKVQDKQESLKEGFKLLKKNRILLLVSIANLCEGFAFGTNLVTYLFKYMIPEGFLGTDLIGALGLTTIFFIVTNVPTLFAMFFVEKIKKLCKDSYVNVLIMIQVVNIIFRIVAFFIGYQGNNLWFAMIALAFASFPTGLIGIAQTAIFTDAVDLMEWKTGKRTEAMTFSMQTFVAKAASGLSQGLAMLALTFVGYVAIEESPYMTQSAAFNTWIWPLVVLSPAIASLLFIIPLLFVHYTNEQKALVEKDLELRRQGLKESGESPYYKEVLAKNFEEAEVS